MTLFDRAGADPGFDQGGGPDHDRPKTAILGPQFCRILVLGPQFWWSGGGPGPRAPPPGSAPVTISCASYYKRQMLGGWNLITEGGFEKYKKDYSSRKNYCKQSLHPKSNQEMR